MTGNLRSFQRLGAWGATMLALALPAEANDKDVAAAVAAGIAGVAIGAALSDHPHHGHTPRNHFSPKPGVTCYNYQAACYHDDGSFAANKTWEYYR